jgi:hypothetical protein
MLFLEKTMNWIVRRIISGVIVCSLTVFISANVFATEIIDNIRSDRFFLIKKDSMENMNW